MPVISVIIPIYNVEKYIEKCAYSLFEQTMQDGLEFIFVNDCTPDSSIDILKNILTKYPQRNRQTRIICHKENRGLVAARQTGLLEASSDYILHLDSDDYLELDALEKFYTKLLEERESDMIIGNYASVYPQKKINTFLSKITNPILLAKEMIMRRQPCNIWNKLIRKSLYNNLEIPSINNGEDYVTMPRLLARAKQISYLDDITYNYTHLNPNSFQNTMFLDKNLADFKRSIEYLESYFEGDDVMRESLIVGRLKYYAISIFYARSNNEMKKISIPDELRSYCYMEKLGNMRLIIFLFRLRQYSLIRFLNQYYCKSLK